MTGRVRGWALTLALILAPSLSIAQSPDTKRPLTIDDVLATERLDRIALSPDGAWAIAVVLRAARPGEVYGRAAYETDPSRGDVWLVSTRTGEKRALTNGAPQAAGYWCATWSPDGQRVAFLSTQPEGTEPRGGDNVRLYVWDRASNAVTRMSDIALMTQGRYGSGVDRLDLRGGADHSGIAHECGGRDENAPFLWLDNRHILMATLPAGAVSGLIDQYGRPFREAARNAALLRDGSAPTVRAVGSGAARQPRDDANSAILRRVDVPTRVIDTIATVPTYPFRSELALSVSPDGKRLAVLATLGALAPQGRNFPNAPEDAWTVERRLGFVDLAAGAPMRWVTMPAEGRYPLDLYGWSPDSRHVALRGRADRYATATPLFVAAADGRVRRLGTGSVGDAGSGAASLKQSPVLWLDANRLVARMTDPAAKLATDWWVLGTGGAAKNVTHGTDAYQAAFSRAGDGHLIAITGGQLVRLDPARGSLVPVAKLDGAIVWPQDPDRPARQFIAAGSGGLRSLAADGSMGPPFQPPGSRIDVGDIANGTLLWSQSGEQGQFLRATSLAGGATRDLLRLDSFMATVDWGRTQLFDYVSTDGRPLHGLAILPPGYQPGRRYPTLVWVYGGYSVRGADDFFADPFAPGIYNLRLYAARGYVVLIPSMPEEGERNDVFANLPKGVLPVIDKLVAMGIADPDRLGVFGQSNGGFSAYGLIAQTKRFKAAVALAGITDLTSLYGTFDPTARGYPGIEHEKSENWSLIGQFGRKLPPPGDAAGYARNSPLSYADRIDTPLLLVHGEFDIRGSSGQAEEMFTALYRQGKTAKLLRYGGESHSLAQSPANVRDIYAQTIAWFDKYLKED